MFQGITKKNTRRGARGELVIHGGVEIWIAKTTKHLKVSVVGLNIVEKKVWCLVSNGSRGAAIQKVGGSV